MAADTDSLAWTNISFIEGMAVALTIYRVSGPPPKLSKTTTSERQKWKSTMELISAGTDSIAQRELRVTIEPISAALSPHPRRFRSPARQCTPTSEKSERRANNTSKTPTLAPKARNANREEGSYFQCAQSLLFRHNPFHACVDWHVVCIFLLP